jgi:arylsulfatase A-like enzyme
VHTVARGTLVTGLCSHQTWLLVNVLAKPYNPTSREPFLNPAFPTYGKLLRKAGYQTLYVGKWHLSIPPEFPPRLEEFGAADRSQKTVNSGTDKVSSEPPKGSMSDDPNQTGFTIVPHPRSMFGIANASSGIRWKRSPTITAPRVAAPS